MKRFKFKLENVLKYRKILKDMQEARCVQADLACQETRQYLQELDEMKASVQDSMVQNAEQGFSLVDHQAKETYNKMILGQKAKEKVRLAKREKAYEFEKAKLVQSAQNFKALDKLKDKSKQLHRKECLKIENKLIDDLVNSRYGLKDKNDV